MNFMIYLFHNRGKWRRVLEKNKSRVVMKMKKIQYIIISFLLFIICTPVVHATSQQEIEAKLKELYPEDTITLNAICPKHYTDEDYRAQYEYVLAYLFFSFGFDDVSLQTVYDNDDYTSLTFTFTDSGELSLEKKYKVKWVENEEEIWNKATEFINHIPTQRLLDLDYIDFLLNFAKKMYYPNIDKYLESNKEFQYHVFPTSGCGAGPLETYEDQQYISCQTVYLTYNDTVAAILDKNNLYTYSVIYVPESTKEDKESYLSAAKSRLENHLGKTIKVDESLANNYTQTMIDFGKEKGFISANINSFAPVPASIDIDGRYIDIIIAKGTSEQIGTLPSDSQTQSSNSSQNSTTPSKDEESGFKNPSTGDISLPFTIVLMGVVLSGAIVALYKIKQVS